MDGRVTSVDGLATRNAPTIQRLFVDERVATLEVSRVLEKRVVLVVDVRLRDFLLNDFMTPVVVEPRLHHLLL